MPIKGLPHASLFISYNLNISSTMDNHVGNGNVNHGANASVSIGDKPDVGNGDVNHVGNGNVNHLANTHESISAILARVGNTLDRGKQFYLFFEGIGLSC